MKIYEFGDRSNPVILLLPGTICHWKSNFGAVIPLLEDSFHVACVSYDGFDETEDSVFPDMLTETAKIEDYIQQKHSGHIPAAYGCSLGGSFVGLLIQRGNIHIDHGILGSSDLDQVDGWKARVMAGIAAPILYRILQKGRLPGWMEKISRKKHPGYYVEKFMSLFTGHGSMAFIKKESIYNQFHSDLVTPLENGIAAPGTTVYCFYAAKMGEQYLRRYEQHFKSPVIHRQDMEHEELLVCHPDEWAALVKEVCGTS